MVNQIDAHEVLCYLNELGYKNISQAQLKEFMKDLKKLIKYDRRQRQKCEKIDTSGQDSALLVSPFKEKLKCKHQPKTTTKCITVEIKKPKYRRDDAVPISISTVRPDKSDQTSCKRFVKCCNCGCNNQTNRRCSISTCNLETMHQHPSTLSADSSKSDCLTLDLDDRATSGVRKVKVIHQDKNFPSSASSAGQSNVFTSEVKSCYSQGTGRTRSKTTSSSKSDLKPKSSFIRTRIPVKPVRSDPVARYQFYQHEWSKCKLPGEDNHLQLRWAIRERLLGGPSVETLLGIHPNSCRSKSR